MCFKEHKCEQVEQTSFKVDAAPDSEDLVEERSYLHEIPEDYKIPNEVLERLKYSEEVKSLYSIVNVGFIRDYKTFDSGNTKVSQHGWKLDKVAPILEDFIHSVKVLHSPLVFLRF